MQASTRTALVLLLALALPTLLAAAPPAQPAPAVATAPQIAGGSACAPAANATDGLFAPGAQRPIETPWDRAIATTTCDCSGFDCGPGCYPYVCVLRLGHCGAICKCNP